MKKPVDETLQDFCFSIFPTLQHLKRRQFYYLHAGTFQLFLQGALYLQNSATLGMQRLKCAPPSTGWMTLLTVFLLPLAAFWAERLWSDAIYHARHEAGILSNTFSPTGNSHGTSLMQFQIYWTSLYIYFALGEQAWKLPPQESLGVKNVSSGS